MASKNPCSYPKEASLTMDHEDSIDPKDNYSKEKINGKTLYRCLHEGCGKVLSCVGNVRRHANIHIGVKSHRCVHCGSSYNQRSNMERHATLYCRRNKLTKASKRKGKRPINPQEVLDHSVDTLSK